MESITGPVHGFHLACYTVQAEEGHFGYAKVCTQRPRSVWDANAAVRKFAAGPYRDEAQALQAVILQTQRKLRQRENDLQRLAAGAAGMPSPRKDGPVP